jgi:hypothetical protein
MWLGNYCKDIGFGWIGDNLNQTKALLRSIKLPEMENHMNAKKNPAG